MQDIDKENDKDKDRANTKQNLNIKNSSLPVKS